MSGVVISAGVFIILIFEVMMVAMSAYLFLAYLYLKKGFVVFYDEVTGSNADGDDEEDDGRDGGGDEKHIPAYLRNLPSMRTILIFLTIYYVTQVTLAIHSHFYFKEISLIFSFHVVLSCIINTTLFAYSKFDDPLGGPTILETSGP